MREAHVSCAGWGLHLISSKVLLRSWILRSHLVTSWVKLNTLSPLQGLCVATVRGRRFEETGPGDHHGHAFPPAGPGGQVCPRAPSGHVAPALRPGQGSLAPTAASLLGARKSEPGALTSIPVHQGPTPEENRYRAKGHCFVERSSQVRGRLHTFACPPGQEAGCSVGSSNFGKG